MNTVRCAADIGLLPHRNYPQRAAAERLVAHLHRLGPRALAEFLDVIAVSHGIGPQIIAQLKEYRRLDPATLAALGGDQFAAAPLRRMRGG